MASVVFVCALVLLAAIGQATNIVKGLYCRDPDTGKLYPVNATWPSQTFCGNYTCKLRKRNITETEYAPIQKIDISHLRIPNEDEGIGNDMAISSSDNSFVVTKKTDNDIQPIFHKDFLKTNAKDIITDNKDLNVDDGYLTESEIKTITDMLHTVKKSDLEAIVDIYNLAQDIYKEIDKVSNDKLVQESKSDRNMVKTDKVKGQPSYWYDPAQYHNKLIDMSHEQTNLISTQKPPLDSNPTFFKGPLSDRDFGKLPYYYPISNFQRQASYIHSKPTVNDLEKAPTETKPCTKAANNYNYVPLPGYNAPVKKQENFAPAQPSTLLPYPFSYVYHYNVSGYPPNYYYNYPWAHAEYNRQKNYPQPYYGAYIVQIPNYNPYTKGNVPENAKSSESSNSGEILDILRRPKTEKKPLADWQTGPLSDKVLEEVRAHLEKPKSLKPIPLKKNIKLERVGKVIKLDELTRAKRKVATEDVENNDNEIVTDEMEAYIERTICENSTEPGYFSIGNLSQPFPACCPQKLDSIHTTREVIKID